ncbi:MAG: hypothetical protein KatS3mg003_0898 [Candidatus Nitrosocaldaceae archaeon]|nr:MAG: hypothetical protein KatS3mg003_0898 [Candidatus Nitrosocaldaceae archaeon]
MPSEVTTFRIDKDVIERLKKEADEKEISLNALINQILRRYIEWELYEKKLGMISIPKQLVKELCKLLPEEEIIRLGEKMGKNMLADIIVFMKGRIDQETFISWLDARLKHSSLEVNHCYDDNNHTIIIKHDLGEKWSLYHKIVFELIFHELLNKHVDIEYNENVLKLSFTL